MRDAHPDLVKNIYNIWKYICHDFREYSFLSPILVTVSVQLLQTTVALYTIDPTSDHLTSDL